MVSFHKETVLILGVMLSSSPWYLFYSEWKKKANTYTFMYFFLRVHIIELSV